MLQMFWNSTFDKFLSTNNKIDEGKFIDYKINFLLNNSNLDLINEFHY